LQLAAIPTLAATPAEQQYRGMVDRYCVTCHSDKVKTAAVTLQSADIGNFPGNAELWEKVIRKLRSNAMPTQGMPQPDPGSRDAFVRWLTVSIDRAAAAKPNPGRTVPHRLNRAEYSNAIRDLLNLDVDTSALLPADDSGYGFDNIGDVLSVSPMLTERYLAAARKISRLAVGDTNIRPVTEMFAPDKLLRQDDRVSEDLPFGSRAGIAVRYYFPVDGDYAIKIFLQRTNVGLIRGAANPQELQVRVNGELIRKVSVSGAAAGTGPRPRESQSEQVDGMEVRFSAHAGPGVVAVTFLKNAGVLEGMQRPKYSITSYEFSGDLAVLPGISNIEISGPFDIRGHGNSPSRQRIFTCNGAADDQRCATQILSTLARRAYRRPVQTADVTPLMDFFKAARARGSFDSGIEAGLQRILVSPNFLFRVEQDPANARTAWRISDLELASRLSFFLWSSIPDDELLTAASRGELKQTATLEHQVRRMLADSRSKAFVSNFTGQWLYVRNIPLVLPDPYAFPDFDDNLRKAFARELELFLDSQVAEDRPVPELLSADYTYVNAELARHYGIPGVYGSHFRRVTVTDDARRGLLGKAGILMVTSYANRTSPVKRGKWLLENVLGAPPPPPPPNVPALQENTVGSQARSVRERLEEHRSKPACAGCHKIMDPLGFALENFDAIGGWRTASEAGTPIDASGELLDGTKVSGPASLRDALLAHREEFAETVGNFSPTRWGAALSITTSRRFDESSRTQPPMITSGRPSFWGSQKASHFR
jgi:hypothetical protein